MESASAIPVTTRNALDGHSMGIATDVNLCTSFTFTRIAQKKAHTSTDILGQLSTGREEYGTSEPASGDAKESA